MPIVGEIAQVVDVRFDQIGFPRPPHDSVIERPLKESRENREDVKSHVCLSYPRSSCIASHGNLGECLTSTERKTVNGERAIGGRFMGRRCSTFGQARPANGG